MSLRAELVRRRCELVKSLYIDKLSTKHEETILDDCLPFESGPKKLVCARLDKHQPLLSHEFLNAPIFHSSSDSHQKTYLVYKLRSDPKVCLSLVKAILAVPGMNPNKGDSYGVTPLMLSIYKGRHDILRELLAHPHIDVNKPTLFRRPSEMRLPTTPESPLMIASDLCDLDAVKLLLEHKDIDVNWRNGAGQTALTIAYQKTIDPFLPETNVYRCAEYQYDIPTEKYASILAKVNTKRKAEFIKTQADAKAIMELLEARPEIHGPLHYRNVFGLNNGEPAPALVGDYGGIQYTHGQELFTAILEKDKKAVTKLLALETIDVNYDHVFAKEAEKEKEKNTIPVNWYLGSRGADRPSFGMSPLTLATQNRNYSALKQLLAHPRIDVNRCDFGLYYAYFAENVAPVFDEKNAFLIAVQNHDTKAFNLLLEHKDIDINKLFPWSRTTVFMECVLRGYKKFVEALLARPELNLNVQDVEGDDALCLAARNGHLAIVNRLVGDSRQSRSRALKALRYAHDGQHVDICLRILGWLYPTPTMFHRAKKIAFLKRAEGIPSVYDLYDKYISVKFAYKIDLHCNVVGALRTYLHYEKNLENRIRQFLAVHKLGKTHFVTTEAIMTKFHSFRSSGAKPSAHELTDLIPELTSAKSSYHIAEFLSHALHKRYENMEKEEFTRCIKKHGRYCS